MDEEYAELTSILLIERKIENIQPLNKAQIKLVQVDLFEINKCMKQEILNEIDKVWEEKTNRI